MVGYLELIYHQFRRRCFGAKISPSLRALTAVAARKQTFWSFDDILEKCNKPVLVDFYATWCGPCQLMAPTLDEVSGILKDRVKVVKIDTEKYPSIADKYRIEALPTFIIFKDGGGLTYELTESNFLSQQYPFLQVISSNGMCEDGKEGAYTKDQFIQRIENLLNAKK